MSLSTIPLASRFRLGLIACALLLSACDTATGPVDPAAPAVLAPDAFSLDLGFPAARGSDASALASGEAFDNAAFRVGVVSTVIGANLLLPTAATNAATRTRPVVVDGVWIWESTFGFDGDQVTFRLEGEPRGREIDWRLGITNRDLDDFTLYTAQTNLEGKEGEWRLYHLVGGRRTEVLRADFEVADAGEREITFSVPSGRDGAGSSVLYIHDGDARAFDWRQEPEGIDHYVEWDAATIAGSITADNYNGGVRTCWDASRANAPCSVAAR